LAKTALSLAWARELARRRIRPQEAFERYEDRLHPFIGGKQKAAGQFAGSFVPEIRLDLFFRNQITKLLKVPLVAKLVMGPSLFDRVDLPDYPVQEDVPG
jgi:2-polyprenyl-6-methoxyphenol hydroxylase-like FAD-dependent oxidoreductase